MLAFICYFFPAVVGLWVFETLTKENLSVKHCIYRFCWYTVLSNLCCFILKKIVFRTADAALVTGGDMVPAVALNYLVISLAMVLVFVLCEVLFFRKIKISVEEKEDETK